MAPRCQVRSRRDSGSSRRTLWLYISVSRRSVAKAGRTYKSHCRSFSARNKTKGEGIVSSRERPWDKASPHGLGWIQNTVRDRGETSATCGLIPPHIEWEAYCRCGPITVDPQKLREARGRGPGTRGWDRYLPGGTGKHEPPSLLMAFRRGGPGSGHGIAESNLELITT